MAVYTPLTQADIQSFLAQYDIGELESFEGIAEGIENTNYLIATFPSPGRGEGAERSEAGGGKFTHKITPSLTLPPNGGGNTRYILTVFEKRIVIEELPYFVALMQWWSERGIHCPQPVKMKNGRALSALKEKPALMVSFLEGEGVRRITPEHILQLGTLAAQMHISGMDFPHRRENALSVKGWETLIDKIIDQVDDIDSGLCKLINQEFNFLSEHWPQDLPSGPIHADLFPDNVFFSRNRLSGVIDFYFACNDAWAYDLAICANAWCFDDRHRFVPERVQALMASYNNTRPMTQEEEAAFPLLLRGAALRFLLTRSHDWLNRALGALVTPKDPMEYVAKLQFFQKNAL